MPDSNADIRLRDLRVLGVALRERSLTRTAAAVGVSQPTVSKILARLRAHFGDPLFVRSGNEMHPTPRAIEAESSLRALLAIADGLADPAPAFEPTNSNRVFKLLVSEVGMHVFLPALMRRVAEAGPRLGVVAVPLDSRAFESRLESGEADLALGAFPRPALGLRRQRLYATSYLGVARRDHPDLDTLRSRAGFMAARHIVVTAAVTGHAVHRTAHQSMELAIPPENVMLRLPSFTAAAIVASHTDAVTTLPRIFAELMAERLELVTFPPPIALPAIEIAQYWHERFHRDAGHRWLRTVSSQLFGERSRATVQPDRDRPV